MDTLSIARLQYRVELHDRFYRSDDYAHKSSEERIQELLLKQKYSALAVMRAERDGHESMTPLLLDGIIDMLAILSLCRQTAEAVFMAHGTADEMDLHLLVIESNALYQLGERAGCLTQRDLHTHAINLCTIVLNLYVRLFRQHCPGDDDYLALAIAVRLNTVESQSVFYPFLNIKLNQLLAKACPPAVSHDKAV
jgi:hypothetical protein